MTLHDIFHNANLVLATYGYIAVFLFIMVESIGVPVPGETMLLLAAGYAGTSGRLNIALVIGAAVAGAIIGDNIGYFIGREGGFRVVKRYGKYVRLDEQKFKLAQYLFMKHGGKVVFVGRFIAFLRMWAAVLAGTN